MEAEKAKWRRGSLVTAAEIGKEYEARGGDYENEAGSKNKPQKGPPEKKSENTKQKEIKSEKKKDDIDNVEKTETGADEDQKNGASEKENEHDANEEESTKQRRPTEKSLRGAPNPSPRKSQERASEEAHGTRTQDLARRGRQPARARSQQVRVPKK